MDKDPGNTFKCSRACLGNKLGKLPIPLCFADNAPVALTLLIAESRAEEKHTMVKVIVNLINRNN